MAFATIGQSQPSMASGPASILDGQQQPGNIQGTFEALFYACKLLEATALSHDLLQ
jgi:hypothetical protein